MSDPLMGTRAAETASVIDATLADAHAAYAAARPNSAAQARAAAVVLPAGSTRSVLDFDPFPFRVARAEGSLLHDVDGFTYVDLLGDYTAGLFGHNRPELAAAVAAVVERGWSLGAIGADEHRLAELICGRFPSISQIRFTNSGTEANLMALSLARHVTGRSKIVVFDGAYHGGLLYFGSGGTALRAPYEFVLCPYNDLDAVAKTFDRHGDDLAAVLVEPMMGAGGGILGRPDFLAGLRQLCTDRGTVLIFDEVMTSRMSLGGAQQRLAITPDLTTLGKYLGGGMTFGAFGGPAEMMAAFDPARGGTLTHGGTFNNNALTMGVGAVAVELLDGDVLDQLFDRGERLRASITELIGGREIRVTGWGSILALHATESEIRAPADLASVDPRIGDLLFHGLLSRGYYVARRGFLALSLVVAEDQIDGFLTALAEVLDELSQAQILRESLTNWSP